MSEMGDKLEPCPFCGGQAVRMAVLDSDQDMHARAVRYFGCRECCVVSFSGVTDEEARRAWNARRR